MDQNRLKMNSSNTKFMLIGSRQQLKCVTTEININGDMVQQSTVIKYLGMYIDETLSLQQHITAKCKVAMWQLNRIKRIRNVLTQEPSRQLATGRARAQGWWILVQVLEGERMCVQAGSRLG